MPTSCCIPSGEACSSKGPEGSQDGGRPLTFGTASWFVDGKICGLVALRTTEHVKCVSCSAWAPSATPSMDGAGALADPTAAGSAATY